MFYLDRHFDRRSGRALWRRCSDRGEAFVWRRLGNADELPAPPGSPGEKRLDPDRREAYSWSEMCAVYAGIYSTLETREYWRACKVVSQGGTPTSKASALRRIDPATGNSYTWEEMLDLYSGEYDPSEVALYWVSCPEAPSKEKRTGRSSVSGAGSHPAGMSSRAPCTWVPRSNLSGQGQETRPASTCGAATQPAAMISPVARQDSVWGAIGNATRQRLPLHGWPALLPVR